MFKKDSLIFSFKEDEISIVVVNKGVGSLKLNKVYTFSPKLEYNNGIMSFDNIENVSQVKSFMSENKIENRTVDLVLSIDGIITRQIEAPLITKKDLDGFIKNNIEEYFTVNIKEYLIDYKVIDIEKEPLKKLIVLLAAIPQNRLKDIKSFLSNCGVNEKKIKIYPQCIANLFSDVNPNSKAVLDLDGRKNNVTILDRGRIFLSSNMNIEDNDDKEEYYNELLENIEYFLNFYSARHFGNKVEAIYIIGKLYKDNDLVKKIEEQYNIKVFNGGVKSVKTICIDRSIDKNLHSEIIGSVIREKLKYRKDLNFGKRFEEGNVNRFYINIRVVSIICALLIGLEILGAALYFSFSSKRYNVQSINKELWKLEAVDKEINDLENQKKELEAKAQYINKMNEEKFDYMKVLDHVKASLPNGVSIRTINIDKENVTATFNINNSTLDVAKLVIGLNNSNVFEPIDIKEVKLDDTVTEASFTLKLKKIGKGV